MTINAIAPATESDSHVNIIHYMRNNIPFSIVMTLTMLNQYAFEDLQNSCSSAERFGIVLCFLVLTAADVVWTVYHCRTDFLINYPNTGSKWKQYALVRSLTSIMAFYSLNYFIHRGIPFNCFFNYNAVAANVMLYLSFLTVATVSYVEHYYWKKLTIPIPLLTEIN